MGCKSLDLEHGAPSWGRIYDSQISRKLGQHKTAAQAISAGRLCAKPASARKNHSASRVDGAPIKTPAEPDGAWARVQARRRRARRPGQAGKGGSVEREHRMVSGIGGQRLAPDRAQIAQFALEAEGLVGAAFGAAPKRIRDQQPRMGRRDHAQAARSEPQAIIDIVEIDRKTISSKPPVSKNSRRSVSRQAAVTAPHSWATRSRSV